tara:strand:- start:13 stop:240 length:228 start_codon:yes stop_codon:yes gene_type:complete
MVVYLIKEFDMAARLEKAIELVEKQGDVITSLRSLVDIQKEMLDNINQKVELLVERIQLQDKILDDLRCDMIDRR